MITAKEMRKVTFMARENLMKELEAFIIDQAVREAELGYEYVCITLPQEFDTIHSELEDKLKGHGFDYHWESIDMITISW